MKKNSQSNKIFGAIISSIIASIFFIVMLALITYVQITDVDKMPWLMYLFVSAILGLPIIGIIVNLWLRIREIKGGEEDEASKY